MNAPAPTASASRSSRWRSCSRWRDRVPAADAAMKARQVGEEEVRRRRGARQDARHRRPRTHRTGSGAARARVRHGNRRARPVHLRARWPRSSACRSWRSTSVCAAVRLPDAAPARDRRTRGSCSNADAPRAVQEGHPDHQHGPRRAHRRGRAGRRHRVGTRRRRRARRVRTEPPPTGRSPALPAGHRDAAHRGVDGEAQELVGVEIARQRARLPARGRDPERGQLPVGAARGVSRALRPYLTLAERLGSFVAQMAATRAPESIGRPLLRRARRGQHEPIIASAVISGALFRVPVDAGVTPVNARAVAAERGVELVESRSTRARNFTSLLSVKLRSGRR